MPMNFQSPYDDPRASELMREVYARTDVLRKPLSGIVSGYHELPYILVAPDEENEEHTVQINGRINVSPRFVITAQQLAEKFGEVFDPATFNGELQGRLFSFAYHRNKNLKVENQQFEVRNFEERTQERLNRVHDELQREENVRTGLIFGPRFDYYPVSIDRFVNEILEREFKV
jgi:hypothetical protein